jgi:hypothetical protein
VLRIRRDGINRNGTAAESFDQARTPVSLRFGAALAFFAQPRHQEPPDAQADENVGY